MLRASELPDGSRHPSGLRALADLVEQAIRSLAPVLTPVPALAGLAPAVDVSAARRRPTPGGSLTTHHPAPGPAAGGPPGAPTRDPDADPNADPEPPEAMDADHAVVWELVALAQAGDGDAFGRLYDRYVDQVYRFIYFRVNDRALAEDFTSETFLRALRRIGTIAYQGRDIGAWFVTIARNIVFDHMKSARHRLEHPTADTIEGDDRAPSPETTVLTQLTNEALMVAVQQLNDEQRECVLLRFMQGFSVSETAEVMGKNDGAVKALQHRAVRKLAELIGGDIR